MKEFEAFWHIPEPFILNCWKHHLGFIRHNLSQFIEQGECSFEELKKAIQIIGQSQLDIYTGCLFPADIVNQVRNQLIHKNVFLNKEFQKWLLLFPNGYKQLVISDNSSWTLRAGVEPNRYIHLHPSRYSPHSMRLKSNTIKTVIALKWTVSIRNESLSIENINKGRSDFFNASPVKSFAAIKGVRKNLNLLFHT